MLSARQIIVKVFFGLGERLALIVLLFAAVIVLSIQNSDPVFSEKAPERISISYSGLEIESNDEVKDSDSEHIQINIIPSSTPTLTPTPTPIPLTLTATANPQPPTPNVDPNDNAIWDKIAECESHQNWSINTGNGYFGGLQFSEGAWKSVGGSGMPHEASRDEQITRGKMLQAARGWGVWGLCAKQLGLN